MPSISDRASSGAQPKGFALRRQVVEAGGTAESAHLQRQVPAFDAHQGQQQDVVGRAQAPAGGGVQQSVVAGVVDVVGDHRTEDHAPVQLAAVLGGFDRPAAKFVGKQRIGPALAPEGAVLGVEYRQLRHGDMARVRLGLRVPLAIEACQHEHVARAVAEADPFEAGLANTKSCRPRQFELGVLDALHVVPVSLFWKSREPDSLLVLDRDLGPCAAHARAGFERFKHFVRQPAVLVQPVRRVDQRCELMPAVEGSPGGRRLQAAPEAEVAGAIVGADQLDLDLLDVGCLALRTAPGIPFSFVNRIGRVDSGGWYGSSATTAGRSR